MTAPPATPDAPASIARELAVAGDVSRLVTEAGASCALIGSMAAAIHGYPRATNDLDLAMFMREEAHLHRVSQGLRAGGYTFAWRGAEPGDPLAGVYDIEVAGGLVIQLIRYETALAREALEAAEGVTGLTLKVVTLPHLVALKLYGGGSRNPKQVSDVRALLALHGAQTGAVHEVCARHGLLGELVAVTGA